MSKVMSKINTAVMSGGKELQGFADVAGVSGKEFAETWKNDPYKAITLFEKGVKSAVDQGQNHKELLGELGIKELRETDTVLRLANGNKQLGDAREHANKGWKEGSALSAEAEERYKTLGSQIQLFKNELFALGRSIGSALAPALIGMMKALTPIMRALSNAPDSVKLFIVALVGIPVVIAPVAFALSGFVAVLGAAATAMEGFAATATASSLGARVFGKAVTVATNPIGAFRVATTKASSSSKGLGKGMFALLNPVKLVSGLFKGLGSALKVAFKGLRLFTGPIGLTVTALTLLATWLIKSYKEVKWFRDGVNGAVEIVKTFAKGIGGGLISSIQNLSKWMGNLGNKAKDFGKQWYDSWKNTKVGKERIKEWNALKDTTKKVFDSMAEGNKKASDTAKVLGKGVSKETKKTLGSYVDMSEKVKKQLDTIALNGGKMTDKSRKELAQNIQKTGDIAMDAVKKGLDKRAKELEEFTSSTTGKLSPDEIKKIKSKFNQRSMEETNKMKKLNQEILALTSKQISGKLTKEERENLEKKLKERDKLTVELTAKGLKEQQAILSRMESNTKPLSIQSASEAIKENAKAEKKAIKEAKKTRDEAIQNADSLLATGDITKEQHDKRVKAINKEYDKQIEATNKKSKELKKNIEKNNKDIWSKMDTDGHVYTGAEKIWKDFSSAFMKYWGSGDSIKKTLTGWWNGYVETFTNLGNKGVSWIGKGFSSLGSKIGSWWNKGMSESQVSWGALTQKLGTAWESTKQWFVNIGLKMGGAIKEGWSMFTSTIGNWWGSFVGMLSNSWTSTKQWFVRVGQSIGQAISTGWNQSKKLTFTVWTSIWNFVKNIWNLIWNKISTVTTWIWNKIKIVWDWVKNKTISAYTIVKNFLFNTWNAIWGKIKSVTTWIWNKIKTSWDWIKNKTVSIYTTVKNFLFNIWNSIWNKIKNTTTWIWNKIKTSWDAIKNKTVSIYTIIKNFLIKTWNIIWNKIKNTTTWIWNKVKSSWDAVKNKTVNTYTYIKNFLIRTWNSIWNKIKNTTTWIWNKIRSSWDAIRNKTTSIFNSVWNTIKNIWNRIWNFLKNTVTRIRNKVVSTWENMRKNMRTMSNSIRNHTVGRFESMYNGAKKWVDKIGGYIDGAKKWMADKASAMGNAVANKAISGLNLMIKGINQISKGITGSKLIDPINPIGGATVGKKLSTGTRKGRVRTNSKGQLKDPTLATVNDKGRGNGKGRNGHQELIIRQGKRIEVPQGKDVVTALGKGDAVVSGAETQQWQAQGIIPQFAKGTPGKKKNLLEQMTGNIGKKAGEYGGKAFNSAHGITKDAQKTMETVEAGLEASVKTGASYLGKGIGEVMDWIDKPKELVHKIMEKMGVNFSGVPGGTGTLVRKAYDNLIPKLIKKVTELFESTDGGTGDASWLFKHDIWQRFGNYTGGLGFNGGKHYGMDFGMKPGTPVYAVKGGKARVFNDYGGGRSVEIKTGANEWNWYMHLSKQIAKTGQMIKAGQKIALSGNTGAYTAGSGHLHFQLMRGDRPSNDTAINPEKWLKSLKGGSQNKKASAWRDDIVRAASQMKVKLSGSDINNIISLINAESSGNAGAVQSKSLLDINTLMGNPAQGLLQYIPQTFKKYAVKGHTNIKSGYDQLLAFFNNKNWRTQFNPNGGWSPSGPRRFYRGGIVEKDQLIRAGEGNRKEMIVPLTRKTRAMQLIEQAKSMMGVGPDGSVNIDSSNNLNDEKLDTLIQAIAKLTSVVEGKNLVVDGNSIVDYVGDNQANRFNKKGYFQGKPRV